MTPNLFSRSGQHKDAYERKKGPDGMEGLAVAVLTGAVEDSRSRFAKDEPEKAQRFLEGATEGHRQIRAFWCEMAGINPAWLERKLREANGQGHNPD